jgi:hypothetical protein
MSKNAWNRPAGADGFVPVIVLRQRLAAMYGARWQALFTDESAVIAWQDEAAAYLYAEGIKWQWMRLALDRLPNHYRPVWGSWRQCADLKQIMRSLLKRLSEMRNHLIH